MLLNFCSSGIPAIVLTTICEVEYHLEAVDDRGRVLDEALRVSQVTSAGSCFRKSSGIGGNRGSLVGQCAGD